MYVLHDKKEFVKHPCRKMLIVTSQHNLRRPWSNGFSIRQWRIQL